MSVSISYEFFPANNQDEMEKMLATVDKFVPTKPQYISVTYGAGGSSQTRTRASVLAIAKKNIPVASHISCIGTTAAQISQTLDDYLENGICNLVVLRGDLLDTKATGDFAHAVDLVAFIRTNYGDAFQIKVAAYPEMHPEADDFYADFNHFTNKIKAGANGAITQYFYNIDAYWRFLDAAKALQISVPITPGIMPITNYHALSKFSQQCGAEIPRWIATRLESLDGDTDGLRKFGEEVVSQMCIKLIEGGVDALHFYSMNQSYPSLQIIKNIGL